MKLMTLSMLLMTTMMFTLINHPLSMGMILLIQTLLIALLTIHISLTSWFSFILFMIMIGGMMVLFIYMTSIASNKKFSFSLKLTLFSYSMMTAPFIMSMIYDNWLVYFTSLAEDTQLNKTLSFLPMMKFISFPVLMITMILIIYLLITLIAVVKITSTPYGPLRISK